MKNYWAKDGYKSTIEEGLNWMRQASRKAVRAQGASAGDLEALKGLLAQADAVVIGAGAGLSTAAGFSYSGDRFDRYFFDFKAAYGIPDMYSGGFFPFPSQGQKWAWWARHIYFNRYYPAPKSTYQDLFKLVSDKNYFVITTNVDHQFQLAGFDKQRLFYTQGDYGLFQPATGSPAQTFDNQSWVEAAMAAQGFVKNAAGYFELPANRDITMTLPDNLIPTSPLDGSEVTTNLRMDCTFVEDEGWRAASQAYAEFLESNRNKKIVFLELGVGGNTPVIIKYPFWAMTAQNPQATYVVMNLNEAYAPVEIKDQSICLAEDINAVLAGLN